MVRVTDPPIPVLLRKNLPETILSTLVNQDLCSLSMDHTALICSTDQLQAATDTEPEGDLYLNYDRRSAVLLLVWFTQNSDLTNGQERRLKVGNRIGKHIGKVRDQEQHLICWAYASGDLESSTRVLEEVDREFMPFCPWFLSSNVEPNHLKPNKVPDPDPDQDHFCYESLIPTALEYFRSHGVPKEPSGQKKFLCKNRPRSRGYKLHKSPHRDKIFNNIQEALMHVVVHNQPVGAELLGCSEMWKTSMKNGIYRGPLHEISPICCYHSVVIVAVEQRDGEWVAVCKLSNGTHIGCDGFLYVSLKVRYMLLQAKKVKKASHVRQYEKGPQYLLSDFICPDMETHETQVSDTSEPRRPPITLTYARKKTRLETHETQVPSDTSEPRRPPITLTYARKKTRLETKVSSDTSEPLSKKMRMSKAEE